MRTPRTIRSRVAMSHLLLVSVTLVAFIALASGLFWVQLKRQLYRDAIQNVETAEGLLAFTPDGQLTLREDYHNHPQTKLVQDRLVEIRDFNTGAVLYRNERLRGRSLGGAPFHEEGTDYSPRSYRMEDGTRVLMISHVHNIGDRVLLIRQAYSIDPLVQRLGEIAAVLCLTLPLPLAIAAWAGLRSASRALQPLDDMITRAEQITPKRLEERLPVANPADELGRLATVINRLLERLQTGFEQLERFTSDVSHELRTPQAALRSVGEVGLQRTGSKAQYHDTVGSMLEEVNRLSRLVENLLLISRMDAGQVTLNATKCDAFAVLVQCTSLLEILAQEKRQSLTVETEGRGLIHADELMLRQALINVIHNAIKFTPEGGRVVVRGIGRRDATVEIHVVDNGPGIPGGHGQRIFERFHRSSTDRGGAGLGLAIAKWIVQENGGRIWLNEKTPEGCHFVIQWPALVEKSEQERATDLKRGA